jgi:N-acetylmuramic acid 6-phosphate etherase
VNEEISRYQEFFILIGFIVILRGYIAASARPTNGFLRLPLDSYLRLTRKGRRLRTMTKVCTRARSLFFGKTTIIPTTIIPYISFCCSIMPASRLFHEIAGLPTEQNNPATARIDVAPVEEILRLINDNDALVPAAVREELPAIAAAVECTVERFQRGGRLIYVGAGTSGRLGIVDASECPPTYGVSPDMVQAVIAGGREAVFAAQEGAEDKRESGAEEIQKLRVGESDVVCGVTASGRTPFVLGALDEARARGAATILVTTSTREKLRELQITADYVICPNVGAEVIMGSTRMKSGTAQKLVLNMLTTASMIRLGKTYGNVMVDLQMTNAKLVERAKRIVMDITGESYDEASRALEAAGGHVKTALVMILAPCDAAEARARLERAQGFVRRAIEEFKKG